MDLPLQALQLFMFYNPESMARASAKPIVDDSLLTNLACAPNTGKRLSFSILILETKFNLSILLTHARLKGKNIPVTSVASSGPKLPNAPGPVYLRLFPSWQTSGLWHAPGSSNGSPEIDESEIKALYPVHAPFLSSWRDQWDSSFEAQECHLGSGREPFTDDRKRVAWETEGFLLAMWLILYAGADRVAYTPDRAESVIEEGHVDEAFTKFLGEKEVELNMTYPGTSAITDYEGLRECED